ncbi:MAG: L,D-transpeptidase family protein [Gemmatimonadetes bacterium]|nr:L,D-transpeptidase family protein [Gemmatimonadota bacterium]NIQ55437.1 L,D-transpeptidase family protein [Gemmatimonadota bacterium]NIU75645.1 L,D-transpeptidase family protein [Gammaproteobacteria bacterium]NIX45320.1 L,D-transpeptidase family protein [Gemmatimonadota bacterium]NIY09603.1 L,D-transpeptidase family protein [Gemmatimonadota bacterium]
MELDVDIAARPTTSAFLRRQLGFPRVRQAWVTKRARVASLFEAGGVAGPVEVYFRVFKREQELEVWARGEGERRFVRLQTYPVCQVSGDLGPKRKEGDRQIPEGFYTIDVLNPRSEYHLSMRVDYPNAVDRARGRTGSLGGDIFIHGGCSTIGCVPVTDEWIEELYLIAIEARESGQRRIPVHIFPTRLDDAGLDWLRDRYGEDHADFAFWENLQDGYALFERTRTLPSIAPERDHYVIRSPPARPLGRALGDPR